MRNPKNFMGETNNCKVYGFCACIGCDLKVSRPIMCHFSDTGKNHKDYSQKISSVSLVRYQPMTQFKKSKKSNLWFSQHLKARKNQEK